MKTRLLAIIILVCLLSGCILTGCASPSDPTFINNASAAINGGFIVSPDGTLASPGLQNRNRIHPFFGTP